MENHACTGQFTSPAGYDYRMYDRVWQRVSPDLNPYPDIRSEQSATPSVSDGTEGMGVSPTSESGGNIGQLPGASMNPCCMGSQAQEMLQVLTGYLEEELAERQCCLTLSRCVKHPQAAALFRTFAMEKGEAVQQLKAAYYLITGTCYAPTVVVEPAQFGCLRDALRTCYHQEACGGFNYQRSADETTDPCLQKLLQDLSARSFRRAEAVMCLLGKVLRK